MTDTSHTDVGACTYDLDADLRIVAVDAGWIEFALANDAPELAAPHPLGRPLIEQISDRTVAHIYQQLLRKVQRTHRALARPFRCDSPSMRRFLELRLEPLALGGVRLRTRLLRAEPHEEVRLLERHAARSDSMVRMCSFCKRIDARGEWCEVEDATVALGLFEREAVPTITHGVCPACYRSASKLLEE